MKKVLLTPLLMVVPKSRSNGQKRGAPVVFRPFSGLPENHSARHRCFAHLIGRRLISPVFGHRTPRRPAPCYFAQLTPVFGHIMFPFGGLLEQTSPEHVTPRQLTSTTNSGTRTALPAETSWGHTPQNLKIRSPPHSQEHTSGRHATASLSFCRHGLRRR